MAEQLNRVELTASFLEHLDAIGAFLIEAGTVDTVREYVHGDYLLLYAAMAPNGTVGLLSIRHHRQLTFDFAANWPG